MAYRRRRMYGSRRRRYSRRRYGNVSRATLKGRLTLAPRHQYLKLKRVYTFRDATIGVGPTPGNATQLGTIMIPLQLPGQSTTILGQYADVSSMQEANGWSAYQNLFQRYVIAGVKVKISGVADPYDWGAPSTWSSSWNVGITRTAFAYDSPGIPANFDQAAISPYGVSGVITRERPLLVKQYINMNSLFGEVVKKHDLYVHDWDSTAVTDTTTKLGNLFICAATVHANSGTNRDWMPGFVVTCVYYIHALQVQPLGAGAAELAMLKAVSKPGGYLGEEPSTSAFTVKAREGHHPVPTSGLVKKANAAVHL